MEAKNIIAFHKRKLVEELERKRLKLIDTTLVNNNYNNIINKIIIIRVFVCIGVCGGCACVCSIHVWECG